MDKLINKAEAAEMLGVSPATLDRMKADGDFPFYRIRGQIRFDEADIRAYLQSCCHQTAKPVRLPKAQKAKARDPHPCLYYPGMKVV